MPKPTAAPTLPPNNRVAFITLGCAKNEVDTDKMRARVLAAGFLLEDDPQRCDALVINTCSFITQATEESINTILEAAGLDRFAQGEGRIVVAGCMPSRYGNQLNADLPEVSAFVPCAQEHNIVEVLQQTLTPPTPQQTHNNVIPDLIRNLDGDSHNQTGCLTETPPSQHAPPPPFLRTITAPWAYVKIADGCSRRCAFCTIPKIKGPYKSVPAPEILAEVAGLVAGGVREVVLIAQDTGIYGHDLKTNTPQQTYNNVIPDLIRNLDGDSHNQTGCLTETPHTQKPQPPTDLPALLTQLACTFTTTWFRVMYLQPQAITSRLLKVMGEYDNICNYLDIPLQHASQQVLRDMRRAGSGAQYLRLLARIRKALPDVALRTTLIAGYPGETRAQAAELERFVRQAQFDYVGVFVYSPEDGTPAGERPQVPLRTRRARAQRLRDTADQIGFAKTAQRLGLTQEVLVLGRDEDAQAGERYALIGRTKRQAPEVDGMVHLDGGSTGQLVSATMVDAYCYELDGKVVEAPHER